MDMVGGGNAGAQILDDRPGGRLDFSSNGQAAAAAFHNARSDAISEKFRAPDGKLVEIRNVWADNLEREMVVIRELVERYPYVAMDTEFPGIVARPVGDFNQPDYQYQTLRCNVDMLKMIQLGLSFANDKGELPDTGCCTWQFNFAFNLSEDMYAHDSIQLLKNSGIDFEGHQRRGIDLQHFGELLMTSGLILMPNVTWISFHSGYDFGYLLKLLTCSNLPIQESDFFDMLQLYFPKLYDIKLLVSTQDGFHGGLNKLAEDLKVERIGPMHQAGSDSLLTEQVFLKVADVFFNGVENLESGKYQGKFSGQLYGYGGNQTGIYRPGSKTQHLNGAAGSVASATATVASVAAANAMNAAAAVAAQAATTNAGVVLGGVASSAGAAATKTVVAVSTTTTTAAATAAAGASTVGSGGGTGGVGGPSVGGIVAGAATTTTTTAVAIVSAGSAAAVSGGGTGGNVVNSSAAASAIANPAASGDPNSTEEDAPSGDGTLVVPGGSGGDARVGSGSDGASTAS